MEDDSDVSDLEDESEDGLVEDEILETFVSLPDSKGKSDRSHLEYESDLWNSEDGFEDGLVEDGLLQTNSLGRI